MRSDEPSPTSAALAGMAAALLAGGCGAAQPTDASSDKRATAPAMAASRYHDGRYTADGLYGGPPSRLTVTAMIADGRIVDVSVGTHATDPTSLDYQRRFAAAVPSVVRGKRIDEVRVGKMAGSSRCPDGFNAAIARIREQAERRS